MAHILQARQAGAVAETKVTLSKDAYHFVVDVYKWDGSAVRAGERKFNLPANLYHAFTITHLKERLATLLPPLLPGGEHKSERFQDDALLSAVGVEPKEDEEVTVFLVFDVDKSQITHAHAAGDSHGLQRTTSVAIKAGSGAITHDRELATVVSIFQDSATYYVTVTATNAAHNINFEGKVQIAESYWTSMTVKELKRKLAGFPATSDRGVLGANKNIKDTDKWGALGVKGKKGDTQKFNVSFELPADANSQNDSAPEPVTGEAAPEIDPKQQFKVEIVTSLLEGNVFLKLTCTSEVVPEIVKSAALPKMTFSVFNVKDLHGLLKGPQWPILVNGWAVFESPSGKIKVADQTALTKLGITYAAGKSETYRFVFAIDPHAALPTPQ